MLKINRARLSYPNLFKKGSYQGKVNPKYDATLLIPKENNDAAYNNIRAAIDESLEEANMKVPLDRWCIKDGDQMEDKEECLGNWVLKVASRDRPPVFDSIKNEIQLLGGDNGSSYRFLNSDGEIVDGDETEIPYGGCYVSALVSFWILNKQGYATRVCANLSAVRFLEHGQPFSSGPSRADIISAI